MGANAQKNSSPIAPFRFCRLRAINVGDWVVVGVPQLQDEIRLHLPGQRMEPKRASAVSGLKARPRNIRKMWISPISLALSLLNGRKGYRTSAPSVLSFRAPAVKLVEPGPDSAGREIAKRDLQMGLLVFFGVGVVFCGKGNTKNKSMLILGPFWVPKKAYPAVLSPK